jgi:DNA-binding transcriptional MerR regulator
LPPSYGFLLHGFLLERPCWLPWSRHGAAGKGQGAEKHLLPFSGPQKEGRAYSGYRVKSLWQLFFKDLGDGMKVKIGELARMAGCQTVTIRYYEKEGLLPAPERSGGNYRLYDETQAERLRFIRHCRVHGMSLDEVKSLLAYQENPVADCSWISALVQRRIEAVDRQIAELASLRDRLERLGQTCSGGPGGCGILKSLGASDGCPFCQSLDGLEGREGPEGRGRSLPDLPRLAELAESHGCPCSCAAGGRAKGQGQEADSAEPEAEASAQRVAEPVPAAGSAT